ncbi:MAG: FAD-dependent oxidoreductase [Armatimonadota bacterium]|nr:FAD-dependent oxidoreductase [Armatimonadota bacterium]
MVTREGKVTAGRGGAPPCPIIYGVVVPRRSECDNPLVTFALSASHVAFASIRMEPVFMITSQSAAAAAVRALDEDLAVQDVDYTKLRRRLLREGQILERAAETSR